ncbi:hypothetical protein [Actinoplanes couchii]|uniref:hypothetical protein n=1 Tax=Actinoplanes couchii TaxID=403638 RepID=UPI0019429623|nr:hypothetical protein [Actinoplanes couchii]MDR6323726.1 hypothetical protein [Actinoplanes couchii]
MISRFEEHGVDVYDAELTLVHTFPLARTPQTHAYSVARARDRMAWAGEESVTCVDTAGAEVWRFELGPGDGAGDARTDVAFADDDGHVWLYSPDVNGGRGGEDHWIVLDGATGAEVARHALPTAGHGGSHLCLGDGRMLLEVGEGQDGTFCFAAGPGTELTRIDVWVNRVPVDVSPDQRQIMTVDHEQDDVAFHDVTYFAETARIPLSAFGDWEFGTAAVEWTGGFLTAETAIVVVSGEHEETEETWWKHFTVDTRAGSVTGEMPISTIDEYDLTPLGDGTYVITDTDGTVRRM